jgi:hypothetical protein
MSTSDPTTTGSEQHSTALGHTTLLAALDASALERAPTLSDRDPSWTHAPARA